MSRPAREVVTPRVYRLVAARSRPRAQPRLRRVKRVLLTGMSGAGKSSVVAELVARGHTAIDTDDGWCEVRADGRQLWREDAVTALLATEDADVLFLAGCEENMGSFLPRFDQVVLLSAPLEVLLERLDTRTGNPFGKHPEERRRFLEDVRDVEPRLRRIASAEIRTTAPLEVVVDEVLRVAGLRPGT
jgi:shikimate kinase